MSDGPGSATSTTPDDYDLMEGIANRRSAALQSLYDRHSPLIFSLCQRIVRDRTEAEDLLVEVFFEVWEKHERFDPQRGSPVTYLVTLARSRSIDRIRSRSRVRTMMMTEVVEDSSASSAADNPLDGALGSEQRERAGTRALGQLDPSQREAIECSFFDGLSHSEIAEKLGKPLGTVKTWIRQGLIQLRDVLRTDS